MKNYITKIILVLLGFAFCTASSCEDPASQPLVDVEPVSLQIDANVNQVLDFAIRASSENQLSKFQIKIKPDNDFTSVLFDSSLNAKSFNYNFEYRIPPKFASQSVIFEFNAYDIEGNLGQNFRRVNVAKDTAIALVETAGHLMYSSSSSKANAYNLETNTALFSSLADTTAMDILDYTLNSSDTLSRSWISPAKGKMVRFNGFDYANATDLSVRTAFEAGAKLDKIDNLVDGDIILTKLDNVSNGKELYIAIRVSTITDAAGPESDSYLFTIKKAP